MLALFLVAAMRYATKLYVVQEILVVLFVVATSTSTILVLAVAFILLQGGIRRTALWSKIGLTRLANLSAQEPAHLRNQNLGSADLPRFGETKP